MNATQLREDRTIARALAILTRRMAQPGAALTSPAATSQYLKLTIASLEHEVFVMLALNSQHQVLATETLFRGTIDGTSVYPREVVKAALRHNAAAVIFAHNHPSGMAEPSQADIRITERLRAALALIDVRVLDHLVVGRTVTSLAERGLL